MTFIAMTGVAVEVEIGRLKHFKTKSRNNVLINR